MLQLNVQIAWFNPKKKLAVLNMERNLILSEQLFRNTNRVILNEIASLTVYDFREYCIWPGEGKCHILQSLVR